MPIKIVLLSGKHVAVVKIRVWSYIGFIRPTCVLYYKIGFSISGNPQFLNMGDQRRSYIVIDTS